MLRSIVVCLLARLSVRAGGAGDKAVAFKGGDSGGGIEPYEKDICLKKRSYR